MQLCAINNYNDVFSIEADGLKQLLRRERDAYNSVIKTAKVMTFGSDRQRYTFADR
jgi:hypothetical protein